MKLLYLALAAGAAAKCRKNDQCGGGEFCNVAKECEACYYPGDIGTQNPACQRYVDACGYACDGSDYPGGGGDPAPGDDPATLPQPVSIELYDDGGTPQSSGVDPEFGELGKRKRKRKAGTAPEKGFGA